MTYPFMKVFGLILSWTWRLMYEFMNGLMSSGILGFSLCP